MRRSELFLGCAGVALACACNRAPAPKNDAAPPASATRKSSEAELARVFLSESAEQRLGVTIGTVRTTNAGRTRTVGGDVIPSSGRSLVVVAPVAGKLAPASADPLHAGQVFKRGDPVLRLTPVATVDRDVRSQAGRAVAAADSRLAAAEARFARTEKLLADGAASARQLEEARADRDVALAERDASKSRIGMLERAPLESDVAVTLRAPEDGVVRGVTVGTSGMVAAGAPLFELVGTSALWVKVSIFVGDLREVKTDAPARARPLTGLPTKDDPEALPVPGPPTADPASATFDLYYALGKDTDFRPGERISVTLPYRGEKSALTAPAAAVLRDVHGVAWVYAVVGERTYERRRVEVSHVEGDQVILTRGIAAESRVLVGGVAQVFNYELTGK